MTHAQGLPSRFSPLSHTHSLTHTQTHTLSHCRGLNAGGGRSNTHTLPHANTDTHTLPHARTNTHTLPMPGVRNRTRTSLLQNIVSFIGLFCKRDQYSHSLHAGGAQSVPFLSLSLSSLSLVRTHTLSLSHIHSLHAGGAPSLLSLSPFNTHTRTWRALCMRDFCPSSS